LPNDKILTGYIRHAVKLNETGIKNPLRARPKAKNEILAPADFLTAVKKNKKALTTFEKFSPGCKREYIQWIVEAKRGDTRAKRIKTAVGWMAQGKSRNWKYR
jgi:uncharacterized protein YdeI (YjbR/CyaY-like superfamily)